MKRTAKTLLTAAILLLAGADGPKDAKTTSPEAREGREQTAVNPGTNCPRCLWAVIQGQSPGPGAGRTNRHL